jgi:hypothetical protein
VRQNSTWLAPLPAAAIETTLHDLRRDELALALTREAITLRRVLATQAVQFPDLAKLAHEDG